MGRVLPSLPSTQDVHNFYYNFTSQLKSKYILERRY